jgi:hypothetical protein
VRRSSRCAAEPGPSTNMGPGSAAHRFALHSTRDKSLK